MKKIAYISLTTLGDVICCMNQLEHLKKIYAPCRITVFAIQLIAELMKNSARVDDVVVLNGGVHGDLWAPYAKNTHTVIHASCADYEACWKCRKKNCGRDFTYENIKSAVFYQLSEIEKTFLI